MSTLIEAIDDAAEQILSGVAPALAVAAAAELFTINHAMLVRKFTETHKVAPEGYAAAIAERAANRAVADAAQVERNRKQAERSAHEAAVFAEALAIFAPRILRDLAR